MIWNQRTVLQPRAQWHLAKKRLDEGASESETLRQGRASLLARGIGVVRTSVRTYLTSAGECDPDPAPCCAVNTVRSSGTLSSDSQFTLSHHGATYPTEAITDACGARVYFEAQVDPGADPLGNPPTGHRGEFGSDRDPLTPCGSGCTAPLACIEGFCQPQDLLYDRYRLADISENAAFYELVTSGTRSEENPLLANRLAGLGLKVWAEDNVWGGAGDPVDRGADRRHLLRSWPARLDNWSAQRAALESSTNPIVRPDLAFMTLCNHEHIDPDTMTLGAFSGTETAPEYTPSGGFKNNIPAMYFDIVPAELPREGELTTDLPGWALMTGQWPGYDVPGGTQMPLVGSPGYFFEKIGTITDGPHTYCTASGTTTQQYTYEDFIVSTHDTMKGTSGGAIVVPEFAYPEVGSPYALDTLRSIGTISGGAGTTWSDVRCGTHDVVTCTTSNDCGSGSSCVNDVCLPTVTCTSDAQCDPSQTCVNGVCFGEADPEWLNRCAGYTAEFVLPGTDVALHDATTVSWSNRGASDPSSATSDTVRDFDSNLVPIEITTSLPNCLTENPEEGCGLHVEEGKPFEGDEGDYADLDEPSSYDEPHDTDQGESGALVKTFCRNTAIANGPAFSKVGLGVGLIGGATLDANGEPDGIGTFMMVCGPYSDESWHLNWRHLIARGRVVASGADALLHEFRWATLRLWRALTFYVEQRKAPECVRICDPVGSTNCSNNCQNSTEILRPMSMQMCPPNYLMRGFGVARNSETKQYLGVAYLNCLRVQGTGPVGMYVRTFSGGDDPLVRANSETVGGFLDDTRYNSFTLGLPHATDDFDRWAPFSLNQHIGKPNAYGDSGNELVEFFCPIPSAPQDHHKVISGIGWKSSPTGNLEDLAIRCVDIP